MNDDRILSAEEVDLLVRRLHSQHHDLSQEAYYTPSEHPTWDATADAATAIEALGARTREIARAALGGAGRRGTMSEDAMREAIKAAYKALTILTDDDGPYIYFPTDDEVADAVLAVVRGGGER